MPKRTNAQVMLDELVAVLCEDWDVARNIANGDSWSRGYVEGLRDAALLAKQFAAAHMENRPVLLGTIRNNLSTAAVQR